MNILFLTQIIPYPPDAGPRVKTWHVLRYMAGLGHRVILASYVRPEEETFVPKLRQLCAEVHTVPIHRSRLADAGYWLRSNFSGRPFLIERDDLPGMRALVLRLIAERSIDVIHADQLTMTQFAQQTGKGTWPLTVFDAHNAVWTIVDRMRQNAPWFLAPVASLETKRVMNYEGRIVSEFDHTLAVTGQDRLALLQAVGAYRQDIPQADLPISVIPIAVDTGQLTPIENPPDSTAIVTLGTLHYPPNADGIRWFFQQVFPLVQRQVPDARLTIIGKNPPQDFVQFAERHTEAVTVTGYIPDLEPYLAQSALMVVPVRAGGGMRVRILEAFARGMPVVTTTVGLEGIEAQPESEVLLADDPEAFADAVVRLLKDPQLRQCLSTNSRRLAETRYDWQVVLKEMDRVYLEIESMKSRSGRNHG
jgi:glycosyltransferase involved in cell wall biosynthesis